MVYKAARDHNLLVKCIGGLGGVRHLAQTPLLAFYVCRQIIRYLYWIDPADFCDVLYFQNILSPVRSRAHQFANV